MSTKYHHRCVHVRRSRHVCKRVISVTYQFFPLSRRLALAMQTGARISNNHLKNGARWLQRAIKTPADSAVPPPTSLTLDANQSGRHYRRRRRLPARPDLIFETETSIACQRWAEAGRTARCNQTRRAGVRDPRASVMTWPSTFSCERPSHKFEKGFVVFLGRLLWII